MQPTRHTAPLARASPCPPPVVIAILAVDVSSRTALDMRMRLTTKGLYAECAYVSKPARGLCTG